jgi:hypothetical protein
MSTHSAYSTASAARSTGAFGAAELGLGVLLGSGRTQFGDPFAMLCDVDGFPSGHSIKQPGKMGFGLEGADFPDHEGQLVGLV